MIFGYYIFHTEKSTGFMDMPKMVVGNVYEESWGIDTEPRFLKGEWGLNEIDLLPPRLNKETFRIGAYLEGNLTGVNLPWLGENTDSLTVANLLANINHRNHGPNLKNVNYNSTVKNRIYDVLEGCYAYQAAYLNTDNTTRILLGCKNKHLHLCIGTYYDTQLIFWTTMDIKLLKPQFSFIHQIAEKDYSIALHPLYLTSKFKRWRLENSVFSGFTGLVHYIEKNIAYR